MYNIRSNRVFAKHTNDVREFFFFLTNPTHEILSSSRCVVSSYFQTDTAEYNMYSKIKNKIGFWFLIFRFGVVSDHSSAAGYRSKI